MNGTSQSSGPAPSPLCYPVLAAWTALTFIGGYLALTHDYAALAIVTGIVVPLTGLVSSYCHGSKLQQFIQSKLFADAMALGDSALAHAEGNTGQ